MYFSLQVSQQFCVQAERVQVVLVGSDIPDLTPSIVDKAFHLLDNAQVRSFQIVPPIPRLLGAVLMLHQSLMLAM